MKGNGAAAFLLGGPVAQFDHGRKLAARVEHHVPGEFGDFAGTQASLDRQENDDTIAERISGRAGVGEELGQLVVVENFRLLACHLTLDAESLKSAGIGRQRENEVQKRESFAPISHSTHEQIIIFS